MGLEKQLFGMEEYSRKAFNNKEGLKSQWSLFRTVYLRFFNLWLHFTHPIVLKIVFIGGEIAIMASWKPSLISLSSPSIHFPSFPFNLFEFAPIIPYSHKSPKTHLEASRSVCILLSLSLGSVGMILRSEANASFKLCVRCRSRTFAITRWLWTSW